MSEMINNREYRQKILKELITELNEKYPGFRELFFINGKFNVRTMIYIKKKEAFTLPVIDQMTMLKDFDEVIFI